jgi:hypothetical protein
MLCEFRILSYSEKGKVYMCDKCNHKLAVSFGNISQAYEEKEFLEFKDAIDKLDIEKYFCDYPHEERVYLRTDLSSLFFSFSKSEIYELRELFKDAYFKFRLYKRANEAN